MALFVGIKLTYYILDLDSYVSIAIGITIVRCWNCNWPAFT